MRIAWVPFFLGEYFMKTKTARPFWDKTGYVTTSIETMLFYIATFTDVGIIFQMTTRKCCDGSVWYMFATNANKYMAEKLDAEYGICDGFPITVEA